MSRMPSCGWSPTTPATSPERWCPSTPGASIVGRRLARDHPGWHFVRVTEVPDPESAELVYGRMRWNTPLSEDHADLLLARMNISQGDHILDLGCGWGELLLRAVAGISDTNGTGVDHDTWALERGRNLARQ